MIAEADPAEDSVATEIHALAQAAYALEAERIGCADFPPLRESVEQLRQSSDRFLVFREGGEMVGALSFESGSDAVVITRLVVSPAHLRRGVATALLVELERQVSPLAQLRVATARDNLPAISLYERRGYAVVARSVTPEGIPIIHFAKSA